MQSFIEFVNKTLLFLNVIDKNKKDDDDEEDEEDDDDEEKKVLISYCPYKLEMR